MCTVINKPYGSCTYNHTDYKYAVIYGLFVEKSFRRMGFSRELLIECITEIRNHGYTDDIYVYPEPYDGCEIPIDILIEYYRSLGLSILESNELPSK